MGGEACPAGYTVTRVMGGHCSACVCRARGRSGMTHDCRGTQMQRAVPIAKAVYRIRAVLAVLAVLMVCRRLQASADLPAA